MALPRRAFITGIAGQDGSYLAEQLLELGCEVHGLVRGTLRRQLPNLEHLRARLNLWPGDVTDTHRLCRLLRLVKPAEIYHLAAVSSLTECRADPLRCRAVNAEAAAGLFDAVRMVCRGARVFHAGTSELFGQPASAPQTETSPVRPRNPYGEAKAAAHEAVLAARDLHGLFVVTGILFNHESPRREPCFVTRKITQAAARIAAGRERTLRLGSLDAARDWSFAGDVARAMRLMLQAPEPKDYVVGTGRLNTVADFAELAFGGAGLDWRDHVIVDPTLCRSPEAVPLVADPSAIRRDLGWEPSFEFEKLVAMMVRHDLKQEAARPSRRRAVAA